MFKAAIRILVRCALLLCGLAAGAAPVVALNDKELDDLLVLYQEYGLPLPPPEAKLIRVSAGTGYTDSGNQPFPLYALGFWLNAGAEKEPAETLFGTVRSQAQLSAPASRRGLEVVDPETVSLEHVEMQSGFGRDSLNAGLATMLQCQARGYHRLARELSRLCLQVSSGGGPDAVSSGGPWIDPRQNSIQFDDAPGQPPRLRLAGLAWNHWSGQLAGEKSDWPSVLPRLRHILETQPALQNNGRRALIRSVEDALKPSTAPPGSVEALIDDLVNVTEDGGAGARGADDERSERLAAPGFDAVPALIAHCDDPRLTHSMTQGFNNFRSLHRHVGEVVSDILQSLAGSDLGTDWLARQVGHALPKEAAQKWWDAAQKIGEEKYALAHVLPVESGKLGVNATWLRVIEHKYPARLPEIYATTLAQGSEFAEVPEAVGRSPLSNEEKLQLFQRGLHSASGECQHWALREIQKLDPALGNAALIQRLDALPRRSTSPVWTSLEARVVNLVMESDSPEVWQALLRAAQRAEVSLRMQLILPMDYIYIGDRQRPQRLAFVAAFLDDTTVRDMKSDKKMYEGPCAGSTCSRMEVRDFAATILAGILKVEHDDEKNWTPAQWAEFRTKVKTALEREH